jgi:hypothetical protein
MKRSLIWIADNAGGWACSNCGWKVPLPTLLTGEEAKEAYDRLAAAKFREHKCESHVTLTAVKPDTREYSDINFVDRARMLIRRGYTPKIAIDLTLHEIENEYANDSRIMEKARADAEDFLLKIRKGLI